MYGGRSGINLRANQRAVRKINEILLDLLALIGAAVPKVVNFRQLFTPRGLEVDSRGH